MIQSFTDKASPEQGPPRLKLLRDAMISADLDGWLVPRADVHQGEYVAPGDERLAWLTGFTGSAGFAAVTAQQAGVFVDGRYRTQVRAQTDADAFQPIDWPEVKLADWARSALPDGGRLGFDPWLHTHKEIADLTATLKGSGISPVPHANLIDSIWQDRPAPPTGAITAYPDDLAGKTSADKRADLAEALREVGHRAAILTLPDSIAWLLNIRGNDIPRNPIPHAFAVLHDDARVDLYMHPAKLDSLPENCITNGVTAHPDTGFPAALTLQLSPARVDPASIPLAIVTALQEADVKPAFADDPCILPKACKTGAEISATREAHLRDGAALCEFLTWFDAQAPGTITEIDVVTKLEQCRHATGKLLDISFETIAGSGPNGALPHYRVSEASNRTLIAGDLLVLDGGGQYLDGTTDITRTLPVGDVGAEQRAAFTRVLQGMIAISRLRFPQGIAGRDIDAIARYPLWLADQDYAHGTGHGVGVYMCVHEGPQRISRASEVALHPGMIVSNEPGYYREGHFGIRIENLLVVQPATALPGGNSADSAARKLAFETLNYVPVDRRLIQRDMLGAPEISWLDAYHADCHAKIAPRLAPDAADWLARATQPI
ncbi:aminopeptidase P family protein [Roseovarius sp. M141]|uniref:aminopeptidase P family protein n=1 Tax=Roseovarius sp. M141 TaxID=2583806 RepID=UPI0020CB9D56|nr:aminopeptidase P family protein [Roseovarius sp. M141]MCQ0093625.1 aminopeptidase P family protein [Roseovarius sp. M141]